MKQKSMVVAIGMFALVVVCGLQPLHAASDKPIELKFNTFLPPTGAILVNVWQPWAKQIEARTNGRVKVTFYAGETLGKARDIYDSVTSGIADVGAPLLVYTPGRFPLASVIELPLDYPSATVGSRVMWEIYEKHLKEEFKDTKFLQIGSTEPYNLHWTKKSAKDLEDMKGRKVKATGANMNALLRAWGGSPLNITATETYDALQKGMADGLCMGFSMMKDYKFNEVTKHHTVVNTLATVSIIVMNLKVWNSFPPDIQKIIDEESGLKLSVAQGVEFDKRANEGLEQARSMGHEVYVLPTEERSIWLEKARPINEAWIADMEKKGLPGRKVYDDTVALLAKYSKTKP
jgi:TRAP-type transport system periplasmic protein